MKISTSNVFFVSDLHVFHSNIIKYCNRPFVDADEMNETIVANWNSKVGQRDNIFLLGDVSFANSDRTEEVLKRLNGNIYLIRGNHDHPRNIGKLGKYFTWERDLATIEIPDTDYKTGYQPVVLSHYPMERWDRQHHGSWMLHGHCHGTLPFNPSLKRLDVGVDVHNFTPISYSEIKTIFEHKSLPLSLNSNSDENLI
jgi:calcineurin-like phosphoesterase family protein